MSDIPFRLCKDYFPTHYDIFIKTDIKSKLVEGKIGITFKENNKSDFSDLFAHNTLSIKNVTQNGDKLSFTHNDNRFRVFGENISSAPIFIEYTGTLDHSSTGFYYINVLHAMELILYISESMTVYV